MAFIGWLLIFCNAAQAQWIPDAEEQQKLDATMQLWAAHPVLSQALPGRFKPSGQTSLDTLVPIGDGKTVTVRSVVDDLIQGSELAPQVAAVRALRRDGVIASDALIDTLWAQREVNGSRRDRSVRWEFRGADLFPSDGAGVLSLGDYHVAAQQYCFEQASLILAKGSQQVRATKLSTRVPRDLSAAQRDRLVSLQYQYEVAKVMAREVDPHLVPALMQLRQVMRAFLPDQRFTVPLPGLSAESIASFLEEMSRGLDGSGKSEAPGFMLRVARLLAARQPGAPDLAGAAGRLMIAVDAWKNAQSTLVETLADSDRIEMASLEVPGGVPYFEDLAKAALQNTAFDLPASSFVFDARGQFLWTEGRGLRASRIHQEPVTQLHQGSNAAFFRELVAAVQAVQGLSPGSVQEVARVFPSIDKLHSYPSNRYLPAQGAPWATDVRFSVETKSIEDVIVHDDRLSPFINEYGHYVRQLLTQAKAPLIAAADAEARQRDAVQLRKEPLLAELRAQLGKKPRSPEVNAEISALYEKLDGLETQIAELQTAGSDIQKFEETYQTGPLFELYRLQKGTQCWNGACVDALQGYVRSVIGDTRLLEVLNFLGTESFFAKLDLDGGGIGDSDTGVLELAQKLVEARR